MTLTEEMILFLPLLSAISFPSDNGYTDKACSTVI
ncbi:hypothetical protein J2T15_005769 [Paenibacillus harenae]|uniref:Uncharacterized protein n=1 Tax=Paenibacillus harenae TaxID=306543 RepID=A0ABT9U9G7_PAEHA|nr:hypothetical protein [Paenibacillus harenae]